MASAGQLGTPEEIRIGAYVCWCGSNIAKTVDVEHVTQEVGKMPNVVVAKDYKYVCSDPGQDLIRQDIREHRLNRVMVASCSPRMHEITFRRVLDNVGVNPYLFEMANIREQCSWVHTDRDKATEKALSLIRAAIGRVAHHEPLDRREVEVKPSTLVVGGGITGMTAALQIAEAGRPVYLVERHENLGGHLVGRDLIAPDLQAAPGLLQSVVGRIEAHPLVDVLTGCQVESVEGFVGNFQVAIGGNGNGTQPCQVEVGNIIVATGLENFDPRRIPGYGYGELPNVITTPMLERMLADGEVRLEDGSEPQSIAIINCVGSRSVEHHGYCSRTCCMESLKCAEQIRSLLPSTPLYLAYTDIRAFGKGCEEFYDRVSRSGVTFAMFDKNDTPRVLAAGAGDPYGLLVEVYERLSGELIQIPADLVVLNLGVEARPDAAEVAHQFGISLDTNGFFIEKHPKLDPVATTSDGIFIAGRCQGPKDVADSVAQGCAAAARILGAVAKGRYEVEVISSHVNEDHCAGCQTCVQVCPYGAVQYDAERHVSVVNEVLCKGCGTCTSTCPAGAIHSRHFTYRQIVSQIKGILASKSASGDRTPAQAGA